MLNKKLSHSKLLLANRDPRTAAKTAHLIYVTADMSGFTRKKKGKGFIYYSGNKVHKNFKPNLVGFFGRLKILFSQG